MSEKKSLRVGSWNTRFGSADPSFVVPHELDLLLLQEMTPNAFEAFRECFADGVHSIGPVLYPNGPPAGHGVAVLWSSRLAGRGARVLPYLVAPHRFLVCDLAFTERRGYFQACAYHALNGEQGEDGFDKPRMTYQVARWLEEQPGPVILGMDANSPDVDHPDFARTRCHFDWLGPRHLERALLGPEAKHRCRDVYRSLVDAKPQLLAEIVSARSDGPLAVSHRAGRNEHRAGDPQRFDHIFATWPDFGVKDAGYDYEGACDAGSDHALVVAELEVDLVGGSRSEADMLLPTAIAP